MKPVFGLKNLTLTFPHKLIFNNVSLTVDEGDKIGILGLNGQGKSSLLKIIAEEITPDTTTPPFIFDKSKDLSIFYIPQELEYSDDDIVEDYFYNFYPELKILKEKLDVINQELMDNYSDDLLNSQAKIYDELNALGENEIREKYLSYIKSYGLEDLSAKISSLSGGEQKKILLSLGFSCPHNVILWDEPTNHLDLESTVELEEMFMNLNKTILLISHDRYLLNNVTNKIFHISKGSLRSFNGAYNDYLVFLQEEEVRRESELNKLTNIHRRETAWIKRGVKARRTKSKKRISEYANLNKEISDLKSLAHKKVEINLKSSQRKAKTLIELIDVGHGYNDETLYSDISLKISKGDKIAILGKNGVGKSTLVKIFQGLIKPNFGEVKQAPELSVGYFSQKRESIKDDDTPWNYIGEGIDFVISNDGHKRHVATYLENFLFRGDELKRPMSTFSGGEKNRLHLAKFMKDQKDLWIFDEPTNDLDLETIGILEEELKTYEGALVIIGHDRAFIENVADKIFLIHDKKIEVFEGGFSQAEYFLEAVKLEEEFLKEQNKVVQEKTQEKKKVSSKDKRRLEEVQNEIEKTENLITLSKDKIFKLDYTQDDAHSLSQGLNEEILTLEDKLNKMLIEWEELSLLIESGE